MGFRAPSFALAISTRLTLFKTTCRLGSVSMDWMCLTTRDLPYLVLRGLWSIPLQLHRVYVSSLFDVVQVMQL